MSSIGHRQNAPEMLDLLRAASVLHLRAQRIEAVRAGVCLLLVAGGAVAAAVQDAAPAIAFAGGGWAIAMAAGVGPWTRRLNTRAAVFQESFDSELFGLPWNSTAAGPKPSPYERNQLVRGFPDSRSGRLRDWYADTSQIPYPYDVFLCQQQNLGWDARLRRRWARTVMSLICAWTLAGIVLGYAASLTVAEILVSWFVPSLGALILGFENYRGQLDIVAERERVAPLVQRVLDGAGRPGHSTAQLLATAREVQDVIFATRRQPARVPDWFYVRFRTADEQDFQANVAALRERVGGS